MTNKYIYLDNAATTKPDPAVLRAMNDAPWGNASTLSPIGLEAFKAVQVVAEKLLEVIKAPPDSNVVFTSGGSEANRALNSISLHQNIIMAKIEHSSLHRYAHYMWLQPDTDGQIHFQNTHNKKMLFTHGWPYTAMHVNNELGTINDPYRVGWEIKNASPRNVFFSDMVQSLGKIDIDLSHGYVDAATFSAHKIHGPKGVGAIITSKKMKHQMLNTLLKNYSTLNVPGIVGFGKALELLNVESDYLYIQQLRELFLKSLNEELGYEVKVNGNVTIPHILNIQTGVQAIALIFAVETKGVIISRGSACTTGNAEPSEVLLAIGLTPEVANTCVRISFAKTNTPEEVVQAGRIIGESIKMLKNEKYGPMFVDSVTKVNKETAKTYLRQLMDELGVDANISED